MDIKGLQAFLETDEGKTDLKKYFDRCAGRDIITQGRFKRFEEWLETNDFDKLMYRLILEHGDEWCEKCWHNGYQPYPNNKLNFLLKYVTKDQIPHPFELTKKAEKILACDFGYDVWEFKGYYIQNIHGQGTITRIYNKEDLRLLLQI